MVAVSSPAVVTAVALGLLLVACGVYVLGVQYAVLRRATPEEGRVTRVEAVSVGGQSDDAHRPVVSFEYERDGETGSDDRLTPDGPLTRASRAYAKPGEHYPGEDAAREAVDYTPGDEVTVYVDPESGQAFLEPRANHAVGLSLVVVGTVLAATGVWLALGG